MIPQCIVVLRTEPTKQDFEIDIGRAVFIRARTIDWLHRPDTKLVNAQEASSRRQIADFIRLGTRNIRSESSQQ
jgi:hypothetical protein